MLPVAFRYRARRLYDSEWSGGDAHAGARDHHHLQCLGAWTRRRFWNYSQADQEVQVRVVSIAGTPLTGWAGASGSATTADWVRDGLVFVLVDRGERELARTQAQVRCAEPNVSDSYLPLQVGNVWVYRSSTRFATSNYVTWKVLRSEDLDGERWYVLAQDSAEVRYRTDGYGRIYRLVLNGDRLERQLWLDPTPEPDPGALLHVQNRAASYASPLGNFPDALNYQASGSLRMETGTLVRGVGLVAERGDILAGSSGGFSDSLDLVYAKLGDRIRLSVPAPSIEIGVEKQILDVSGRQVTNCAVPCYFVACSLVPGADPPGTYKPCFQIRTRLSDPSLAAFGDAAALTLELLNERGQAVWQDTRKLTSEAEQILYAQAPLYSAPNQPFPVGTYRVRATPQVAASPAGTAAAIAVRLQ